MNGIMAGHARAGGIAIIDFGSQVTQLIARRIREANVYSEILLPSATQADFEALSPRGVILSGGPASVWKSRAPQLPEFLKSFPCPVLGICYGMQLLGWECGGRVAAARKGEFGPVMVRLDRSSLLFKGIPGRIRSWMSHRDAVARLPAGFRATAWTENCRHAAMENRARGIYGVQFHPEVIHSEYGKEVILNFVFNVCNCRRAWTMEAFEKEAVAAIKERTRGRRVLCALSGGVDSTVMAVLVNKAVGKRLTSVFVDNGLLRKNEGAQVVRFLRKKLGIKVKMVRARRRFLRRLKGVSDPEKKRKRIGTEFIRVFEETVRSIGRVDFLAQGTLYPDVIESTSTKGPSATIKTHHNVGGLPKRMKFFLIEPLRQLFKDEVRALGKALNLPKDLLWRHPFPGPGLAVRVIGEVTEERLRILREADAIAIEVLKSSGQYDKVWQAFTVLLPVKTVGVMGDERTYANVVAFRAVTSSDGMTADWAKLPYDVLSRISTRIINEVRGVNRVTYDISSKPPSTIEWE